MLHALLTCLGDPVGSALDNLDLAARLGLLAATSEDWIAARTLRNRMVHGYIRIPKVLAQAVNEAHAAIPMLVSFVQGCRAYAAAHGLGATASGQRRRLALALLGNAQENGQAAVDIQHRVGVYVPEDMSGLLALHSHRLVCHHLRRSLQAVPGAWLQGDAQKRRCDQGARHR